MPVSVTPQTTKVTEHGECPIKMEKSFNLCIRRYLERGHVCVTVIMVYYSCSILVLVSYLICRIHLYHKYVCMEAFSLNLLFMDLLFRFVYSSFILSDYLISVSLKFSSFFIASLRYSVCFGCLILKVLLKSSLLLLYVCILKQIGSSVCLKWVLIDGFDSLLFWAGPLQARHLDYGGVLL